MPTASNSREYEFPHELWDKFTEAGLHAIGIDEEYGGQGGDIISQMILCRRAGSFPGGLDVGVGHLFVLRGQVGRALRLGAAEAGTPSPTRQRRDQVCHRIHGAGGRHRSARRDDNDPRSGAGTDGSSTARRSGPRRPTSPTTCCYWLAPSPSPPRRARVPQCSWYLRNRTA